MKEMTMVMGKRLKNKRNAVLIGALICLFAGAASAGSAATVGFETVSSSVGERAGSASIAVVLDAASAERVTVSWSVTGGTASRVPYGSGTDYSLASGTLTFEPGATLREIPVEIVDDAINEADETVEVTLSGPVNAALGERAVHTLTIIDNDRAMLVDVKRDFGAAGDGITDDTGSIQNAVNGVAAGGGGVILFPAGTYLVVSVGILPNITYQGYGATIIRPPNQGKWTRTFTILTPYSGLEDSKPLIIKGLTFDGNSQNQGPYKNYELEQAALVFLAASETGGAGESPGRLTAVVEDCTFRNGVGDGVHFYTNVLGKMYNCLCENVFRGGFVLTGGHTNVEVRQLTTRGNIDPTGIDIEVDGPGYQGRKTVDVLLEDIHIESGDFDIGVSDSSTVVGKRIDALAPFFLYGEDSTLRFSDSSFGVGVPDGYINRICVPQSLTFDSCTFTVTEDAATEANRDLSAAQIYWGFSWLPPKYNESVTFNDCSFLVDGTVEKEDRVIAVNSLPSSGLDNNTLTISGGSISTAFDIGVLMPQGGKTVLRNAEIGAETAVKWTGFAGAPGSDYSCDITLDSISVLGKNFISMDADNAGNHLAQTSIEVDESSNGIIAPQGTSKTQKTGSRVILGSLPPTTKTMGFIGDVYRLKNPVPGEVSQWKCTKAGYLTGTGVNQIPSAWEAFEEAGVQEQPLSFSVKPPVPNPFNPSTVIEYRLPANRRVIVTVHDILGRLVTVLEDGERGAGVHRAVWNGKTREGTNAASGVYLYRVTAGKYHAGGKMLLVR
jgi:hypothetical protein